VALPRLLATAEYAHLRLAAGALHPSTVDAEPVSFTYDPLRPTPTIGGPLLDDGGGYVDDAPLAARPDVAVFTGAALAEDLEILGTPVVELEHTADNPYADVFVRLSDVAADGSSRNVTEGYLRLPPERAPGPVRVVLRPAAHRFVAGSSIRLVVAGGSHPQYARNLGTAELSTTGTTTAPSTHTLGPASTLTLPTP
jgi:putative CocE/NonD family hydrolase